MKKTSFLLALGILCVPLLSFAQSAEVEVKTSTTINSSVRAVGNDDSLEVTTGTDDTEASTDAYLKIKGVDGESTEKKGNVEYEWKVEEGESATKGIEPDEIDVMADGEPLTPDFGILLGGEESEERTQGLLRAQAVLLENAKASDQAIESVSLNYEKISTRVKHEVRVFGFIPATVEATVDIDAEQNVKVTFPWWTFLATGKNSDEIGDRVFATISNVLKTKHDTVKNSINNVR